MSERPLRLLDLFCGALPDQDVVLALHVSDDVVDEFVPRDADGFVTDDAR